jgi:aspartyl-tRNA(Asn)/glutamyl-tRNA(Gln) amidotransferase subunit A
LSSPVDLGILGAAELLRAGRLSSGELLDASLQRIEERNGGAPTFEGGPDQVNAWARFYPEVARKHAAAAADCLAHERDRGPLLCGIPLALKDIYAVAGLPLTASSRVLEGNVPEQDSTIWNRMRKQGAVLVGHAHTHEFAAGGTTDQVGNPWDLARVVGGSSGGNAAALAAGMVPAAIGTDTCGSLRIPSACCGTSAIKPTYGSLPLDGIVPLAPPLDHPGSMARSVADCSVLLAAMGELSPDALPHAARAERTPLAGIRVAVSDRARELEPPVAAAFDRALAACAELGAQTVQPPIAAELEWDDLSALLLTEVWSYHAQFEARRALYRPAIAELVEIASRFDDHEAYAEARWRRERLTARWHDWFALHRIDVLIEPTLALLPLARGPGYDPGHAGGPGDPMIALTALWNMTGMPVVSLPVDWNVGISLVAPRGHEAVVIQVGIDLQEHALGPPRWSPPSH